MGKRAAKKSARTAIAVIAGYFLVLQSLLAAFSLGASATPWQNGFAPVICGTATAENVAPDSGGDGDHRQQPPCCVVGCPTHSAAPVELIVGYLVHAPAISARLIAPNYLRGIDVHERSPQAPRAPPRLI
jgi:hypothetical protein